jgi:predicted amidophosphoribosyltransferase
MKAHKCEDCQWIGEPDYGRAMEKLDEWPAFEVVIKYCAGCGGEELTEVTLCSECQREGIDNEAAEDGLCAEHAAELDTDFRRDLTDEVEPLIRA